MTTFEEQLDSTDEGVPTGASYVPTSFEERFPSLERKHNHLEETGVYCGYDLIDIQECCLDKQRVKEVLERMLRPTFMAEDHSMAAYNQALKELNL